jgi:hypothetical protein
MAHDWSKAHHHRQNHRDGRETPHGIILPACSSCLRYEKLKEQKLSGPQRLRGPKPASTQVEPARAALPCHRRSAKNPNAFSLSSRARLHDRGFRRNELKAES